MLDDKSGSFSEVFDPAMKYKRVCISALSLAFLLAPFQGAICAEVNGVEQRQNVDNLTHEIQWFDNLRQAQESARQKGKMVFYMHMLGKMTGAT